MSSREPRKRIPTKKPTLLQPIEDELSYTRNKCSERARRVKTMKPNVKFDIWFDQHYQIRKQFGDESGARPGIDSEKVESLVLKSMEHLLAYSAILKNFTFINHQPNGNRANRVVLQEATEDGRLNVVIEAHLIEIGTYEITVKTAMCNDGFTLSDNQFAIEIIDNESIMKKMENGKVKEIYNL